MARHVCAGPSPIRSKTFILDVRGVQPSPAFEHVNFIVVVVTIEGEKLAVVPAKSTKEARLIAAELAVKKKKKPKV